VHAFRVATRQLISLVLLAAAAADVNPRKLQKRLKRGLRITAKLRDLDVQMARLGPLTARYPILQPLAGDLGEQRFEAANRVRWRLAGLHAGRLTRRFARNLGDGGRDLALESRVRARFAAQAAKADRRLARRTANANALHRARLAIKKLRYMAEALEPVTTADVTRWIAALHAQQSVMGDIHDLDVLSRQLIRYGRTAARTARKIRPICALLGKE
jgi:CHAD domain-containing protein